MDWKEFIKPDRRKLVLFCITFCGINYFCISTNNVLDARELFGLPLPFYPKGSFFLGFGESPPTVEFSWFNFILDIIFWYLIASIVFYFYNNIRNKE